MSNQWTMPGGSVVPSLLSGEACLAAQVREAAAALRREGLWSLALVQLQSQGVELQDDERHELRQAVAFQLRCQAALREIGSRVEGRYPVLVVKGLALATQSYPRPGQRVFGDIDLSVPLPQAAEFHQILTELGYQSSDGHNFYRQGLALDVHSGPLGVLEQISPGLRQWWQFSQPLAALGPSIHCLPWQLELLTALLHGAKHGFSRANWLVDCWLLAQRVERDSDLDFFRQARAEVHLWLAQECLLHWFGLNLPPKLAQLSRPPRRGDWWSWRIRRLVLARRCPDSLGMLTPLWCLRGWSKLAYLAQRLFPRGQGLRQRCRRLLGLARTLLQVPPPNPTEL